MRHVAPIVVLLALLGCAGEPGDCDDTVVPPDPIPLHFVPNDRQAQMGIEVCCLEMSLTLPSAEVPAWVDRLEERLVVATWPEQVEIPSRIVRGEPAENTFLKPVSYRLNVALKVDEVLDEDRWYAVLLKGGIPDELADAVAVEGALRPVELEDGTLASRFTTGSAPIVRTVSFCPERLGVGDEPRGISLVDFHLTESAAVRQGAALDFIRVEQANAPACSDPIPEDEVDEVRRNWFELECPIYDPRVPVDVSVDRLVGVSGNPFPAIEARLQLEELPSDGGCRVFVTPG